MFGMLLVALKYLQAGLQQALEFTVAGGRNQCGLERAIDGLVISDFIGNIGLVEGRAIELGQLVTLGRRLLGQRAAGVVVFRRDLEFLDERERLLVHLGVVALHLLRKLAHFLVLGFRQGLLGRVNVELTCGIGDVRNLRIGRFCRALGKDGRGQQAKRGDTCG